MPSKGHEPVRMCVVCRRRQAKSRLERFVKQRDHDGRIVCRRDPAKRLPGRGYYLCTSPGCQKKFPPKHCAQNSSRG